MYKRHPLKKILIIVLVSAFAKAATAQSYVDLVKVNYATVVNAGYENSEAETNVNTFDVSLTYPIKLSEKTAIITGVDYSNQQLEIFPNTEEVSLSSLTLKVGVSIKHSDTWSGTYVLLPKIASQNLDFDNAFQMGGIALLKYQKSETIQYRFGVYSSTEGFGTIVTPILGLYYLSESKYWESTINFPINGDVNYTVNERSKIGLSFQSPIRSYQLSDGASPNSFYVQSDIIEVGPYLEHSFSDNSILLRFQAGYTSLDYSVYGSDDKLPFRLSAFELDDNRDRLNDEMTGNFFFKIGVVYRFWIAESPK